MGRGEEVDPWSSSWWNVFAVIEQIFDEASKLLAPSASGDETCGRTILFSAIEKNGGINRHKRYSRWNSIPRRNSFKTIHYPPTKVYIKYSFSIFSFFFFFSFISIIIILFDLIERETRPIELTISNRGNFESVSIHSNAYPTRYSISLRWKKEVERVRNRRWIPFFSRRFTN